MSHSPYADQHSDQDDWAVANEEWRTDPQRKQAWRDRIEQVQTAYAEADRLLREANAVLASLGPVSREENALVARSIDAVRRAVGQFASDGALVMAEPTDTYLGNKAAFGTPPGWRAAP